MPSSLPLRRSLLPAFEPRTERQGHSSLSLCLLRQPPRQALLHQQARVLPAGGAVRRAHHQQRSSLLLWGREKAMRAVLITVGPHDLALIVDPEGIGKAGEVQRREHPVGIEKVIPPV